MIFGIGTDIVDVNRIKNLDSLDDFVKKILSSNEKKYFENLKDIHKVSYVAKQFAGKESVAKAFGTGITGDIKFSEIQILRNKIGKPYLEPIGSFKDHIDDLGIIKTHVSLSDEEEYAIGFAILEKK